MKINEIMSSPLTSNADASFVRLVLAEAGRYGMPPSVIALLDDVAAMLGLNKPMTTGQASYMAGPFSTWRSDRRQPTLERITELEFLAVKQRALINFGGGPENHIVGTAEIVIAMGNTHRDVVPPAYWEVFQWASVDAMATVMEVSKEAYRKSRDWPVVLDEDVLKSGGRLNATYQELSDHIRRSAIGNHKGDPDAPRTLLRPLAQHFLTMHYRMRREAEIAGRQEAVRHISEAITMIQGMYPGLVISSDEDHPDNDRPEEG